MGLLRNSLENRIMKRLLICLVCLALTSPLFGAEEGQKPGPLTPAEIADGWIMLFDGETTFGWTSPNDSKWTIWNSMLAPQNEKPGLLVSTTAFGDCQLQFEMQTRGQDTTAQLLVNCDAEGKPRDGLKQGAFALRTPTSGWWKVELTIQNGVVTNRNFSRLGGGFRTGAKTEKSGGNVVGHLGLSGSHMIFRNVKLKPLETRPIFNGRDLAGWKEFPDKKSKFGVSNGALTITGGPGDIQTEEKWGDFVAQLECRTNGKYLNSGVFFRCRPGEYQQGYEAQIHNRFTDKPEKEYVIEQYDPKSNQLTDTKKEKFAAMDYGTGGIYRRMPARKAVAKDNEWFTMTIVGHGRHIATWVDGVQVVDWTDNRPMSDNARTGCRLEKGPLSLQGHDPTTDLSFRNMRVADLVERPGKVEKPTEKKD
jgi:hypothetical protein